MGDKVKIKTCDCGRPLDDEPEHVEEHSSRHGERFYQCRPTRCAVCRNKGFWGRWEAYERSEEA
jgi:hypothetical protein